MQSTTSRLRVMGRMGWTGWALLVATLVSVLSATTNASNERTGWLLLRVEDTRGQPLAARVRVRPEGWSERGRLGLWGDIDVLARDGHAQVALAPGRYQVFVSRGTEWSLARSTLDIPAGVSVQRTTVLSHQVSLPGWRAADLHVHTEHSDDAKKHGGVSVAALLAEGIEFAVGTDHNRVGGLGPGIDSAAGAEITTWNPEVGHFNAFPLSRMPRWHGTSPTQLFAELRRDPDVFVQVNHPRLDDHIAYFTLGGFDGQGFARAEFNLDVDGLEVWNGYDLARPEKVDALLREWRGWIARGKRLTATGGSDCHGATGHRPGYPRTYVQATTAAGMAAALRVGRAFVSNGPLLSLRVNGAHETGATVTDRKRRVEAEITVLAPDWMKVERAELWAGETLIWSQTLAPERESAASPVRPLNFRARVVIDTTDVRTLHAVARGGSGLDLLLGRDGVVPLAFTNPIYFERTDARHTTPK